MSPRLNQVIAECILEKIRFDIASGRPFCKFTWCWRRVSKEQREGYCSKSCKRSHFRLQNPKDCTMQSKNGIIFFTRPDDDLKIKAYDLIKIGKTTVCLACGCEDIRLLEINHNNCDGKEDRTHWRSGYSLYSAIVDGIMSENFGI